MDTTPNVNQMVSKAETGFLKLHGISAAHLPQTWIL
jgi:hypothetical protein